MTSDKLRALADALEPMARAPRFEDFDVPAFCAWVRACADAKPVRAVPLGHALSAVRHVGSANYPDRERAAIERLCSAEFDAYTNPAPAAPQAEPKRDPFAPDELERIIDDYVADYELSDGEVSRDVSDEDRFMLKDAIMGLLVDPAWDRAWGALIDQRAREQAEPKREPLGGSNAE